MVRKIKKSSKKKPLIITVLILFVLGIIAMAILIGHSINGVLGFTEKSAIRVNWGVQIPIEFRELFNKSTESFHGDGGRYTVYMASKQSDFLSDFTATKSREIEAFVSETGISLDVPSEYQPDLSASYTWTKLENNDTNTLVMLYTPETMRLFVVQFFS